MTTRSDEDLGKSLIGLVMIPFVALYAAFVMQTLWGWFVVPLGVMSIGNAHAYGLMLTAGVLKGGSRTPDPKSSAIAMCAWAGVYLTLMWGIGGICAGMMN